MDAVQIGYDGLVVGQAFADAIATPVALVLRPAERRDVDQVGRLRLRTPLNGLVELRELADLSLGRGRYKILREGGRRVQTVTANLQRGTDPERFVAALRERLARAPLAPGNYAVVSGAAQAQAEARRDLLLSAALATASASLRCCCSPSATLRHVLLTAVNLPFALIGGVVAVLATGGWLSLGSLVGFVTLFGITLRNSIMLVSHYQHLVKSERLPWELETAMRGALERLPSDPDDRAGDGARADAAGARQRRSRGARSKGRWRS